MTGKAMAYTGAPINGGEGPLSRHPRSALADLVLRLLLVAACRRTAARPRKSPTASAMTEADGTFTITFIAKPDLSVPEKDEPTFHFTVHADVTDSTRRNALVRSRRASATPLCKPI